MHVSMYGLTCIPAFLMTFITVSDIVMCGHVSNLDIQLQKILQHYPGGIPQSVSQRLQEMIRSKVQSPASNATYTKNDTKTLKHTGNNTKNKTFEKAVSGESKSIPLPSSNVATKPTVARNDVHAVSIVTKTNVTNHNEEKNINNTGQDVQHGETEYQTKSKSNTTKKLLNLKHKVQKVDHVVQHGDHAEKPVLAEKKSTVTTSSYSRKSKQDPNHKPKFTTLHQQKIKDNKDKNKLVSHMATHPIVPEAKVGNGLSELKQIPVTKKQQHPTSLHSEKSNLNHKDNFSKRRISSVISPSQSHTSSFARKIQKEVLSSKQAKQNQNNFFKSHLSVPRKAVAITDTKPKDKEMSTTIFSFSSPRIFNQNVLRPRTPALPFNIRQKKKKFSLTPTENQISRPGHSVNAPFYQKNGPLIQPTIRSPNSWKIPVPERRFPWKKIPNKHMAITPSPNTLYDQPTAPNNYYYDNYNYRETVHMDGPYPQNALAKPSDRSSMNKKQTWQNTLSVGANDRVPPKNRGKPERLVINFQGPNKPGNSKPLTGSNKNFPKEVIDNQSRKVGNVDTPQQWSSQPSVVYSNPQDNTQNKGWNKREQSPWQSSQIAKKSPPLQGSPHSSVVYSKFQDSPPQNWNENNQGTAWGKPRNVQNQRFNEKSGRNSAFIYTTTTSPPFYPNPSPSTSMFTSSNTRRGPQLNSQTNMHTFSQGTTDIRQNPSGWNDFKTPVQDKSASMINSKPRDAPFHSQQANKMVSPSDITIAPNFLYNQEQTSQHPRQVYQQQRYSNPQRNPSDITYQEMPKVAPWPAASTPAQTQTVVPTTYRNEFSRQGSFATNTPNGWSMVGSLNTNQNMYGTTTPSFILQQGNNQEVPYQNTQQRQNMNALDYQNPNRQIEFQQQPQQHNSFKQPQLKQGFQPQQQNYPDFRKETNQQQQNSFSDQGNHQQNFFQNQQQKPPKMLSGKMNQQSENSSPFRQQQPNKQQTEPFGQRKKTFSNQHMQQTSQNQNEKFGQQRQNSFPNQQKSDQQQIGKISNSPPFEQQTIDKIGLKQNQSLSSNKQSEIFDNSFQNNRQQNLQQNENIGRKQLNQQQNGPVFQQPQNDQQQTQPRSGKMGEQQQRSFGNRQQQSGKMGEQQQRSFGNRQHQRKQSFSNQQQQQPNQQQTELMSQQRQNSIGEQRQQQHVQQNTQNSFKNQQQTPMFQQQRQQKRKNMFNQIQRRQPIQQQQQQQQQQQFQQRNQQQRFPQKPGNNAKGFARNQGPFKGRKPKKIPAPAYLTFGVYYSDGSTTEEEHQLVGNSVHTITRYNAEKVERVSDYLTMDHTWSTFGLVSQGSDRDTCYVGKLQADIMQSYEKIVNKTRFSDIPFIEAENKNFVYQELRQIDYNEAVNEVGVFVADSCGHKANIFHVARSHHRQLRVGKTVIPPATCLYGPPQKAMNNALMKCYMGNCMGNHSCNAEYNICCPRRPQNTRCRKMSIGKFCVMHMQYGYYPR